MEIMNRLENCQIKINLNVHNFNVAIQDIAHESNDSLNGAKLLAKSEDIDAYKKRVLHYR